VSEERVRSEGIRGDAVRNGGIRGAAVRIEGVKRECLVGEE
jgi:hypothetical protein